MNKAKAKAKSATDYFKSTNPLLRVIGLLLPAIKGEENFSKNLAEAKRHLSLQDAALVQALSFGTARFYHRLDFIKNRLLKKPLALKDADINALLLLGFFQLIDKATPDYAIVDKCVRATSALNKSWAKGLVNGILRNFIRKYRDSLVAGDFAKISSNQIDRDILEFSHPYWIIENLRKNYKHKYRQILQANNLPAPLVLRTNNLKNTQKAYLQLLDEAQILAKAGILPTSIYLEKPQNVYDLPNFAQGFVSLQDEAGQLLPYLLDLTENLSILDACAAPGSKSCAILETGIKQLNLIGLDKDASRLDKLKENLQRLDLNEKAVALVADFLDLPASIKEKKFDRILLDVPCSASGIIRRQPDIKLMRKKSDLQKFIAQEYSMLEVAKNLLKAGGLLLYSTCSIFFEENSGLIARFLQQNPDFKLEINLDKLQKLLALDKARFTQFLTRAEVGKFGIQLLPSKNLSDGFFYAPLRFKS